MSTCPDPRPIVSARITALILDSPRLRRQLFPEGLSTSPYTVLNYHQTLTLRDTTGTRAVFRRVQRIQFQHDSVGAILDHFWGDGVALAGYTNTAGPIAASFRDGGLRHLVIRLPRPMRRGEVLEFVVERVALEAFTEEEEWEETTIDHPIRQLSRTIVFPAGRACNAATLTCGDEAARLHIFARPDGGTELRLHIPTAQAHTPYTVRWSW